MPADQKKTDSSSRQNRLRVLLGLSLLNDKTDLTEDSVKNCPDEETVACYFDNELTAKQNKDFISLLSNCPASYALWISMLDTLGYSRVKEQAVFANTKKKFTLLSYFNKLFTENKGALSGAVATTFLFVVVMSFSFIPFTQLPLEKQIVKVWENEEVLDLVYIDVSEFIPNGSYKSSFNVMPFPEKIAFSSGFKQGLISMSSVSNEVNSDNKTLNFLNSLPSEPMHCERQACERENALNKQLGIWSSFVLQQCQQNMNSSVHYWEKQNIVIKHFIKEYQDLPHSNTLFSRVNRISESLQRLAKGKQVNKINNQLIACNSIKQMALYSIQGL